MYSRRAFGAQDGRGGRLCSCCGGASCYWRTRSGGPVKPLKAFLSPIENVKEQVCPRPDF